MHISRPHLFAYAFIHFKLSFRGKDWEQLFRCEYISLSIRGSVRPSVRPSVMPIQKDRISWFYEDVASHGQSWIMEGNNSHSPDHFFRRFRHCRHYHRHRHPHYCLRRDYFRLQNHLQIIDLPFIGQGQQQQQYQNGENIFNENNNNKNNNNNNKTMVMTGMITIMTATATSTT